MSLIHESLPEALQYCARRMTHDTTTLFLYIRTICDQYGNTIRREYIVAPEGSEKIPNARISVVLWFNPIKQSIETLYPSQYFPLSS